MKRTLGLLGMVTLIMMGCGGGGGSTTSTATSATPQTTAGRAQGVYSGTSSNGWAFYSIVLPTDKYYAIYGTQTSSAFLIFGVMTGQGTSGSSTYTASVSDYYYTGLVSSGNVNATYVAGSSISGSIAESGSTLTFNGTVLPSSDFNYNTPASLSAVTGTWTGSFLDGSSGTVTVSSTGNISGSSLGCTFTGTVTPDSARNFYNATVVFGPSPCLLPGQTASGVAVTYQISGTTKHQLLVGGATSTMGTVFAAVR